MTRNQSRTWLKRKITRHVYENQGKFKRKNCKTRICEEPLNVVRFLYYVCGRYISVLIICCGC